MFKVTIHGLLAHKLRLGLTALAVVLGIAFVAGTFVLTDTINGTFDRIFTDANAGVAVTVAGRPLAVQPAGGGDSQTQRATIPESDLATVRRVPGVAEAAAYLTDSVTLIGRDGKPVGSGAPTFGIGWVTPASLSPYPLRAGRAPGAPDEVVVDVATARAQGFTIGGTVRVVTADGTVQTYRLVGECGFGSQDSLGGANVVAWQLSTAQQLLHAQGRLTGLRVAAASGVTDVELRNRVAAALGSGADVETGGDASRQGAQQIESGISVLSNFLLAFAGISLFVGCFIIVNTFSILVVQRTRELALLRALGARRRQVLVLILTEAFVTGVVASFVGVGVGILIAKGLIWLAGATGNPLPTDTLVIKSRTFVIAVVVGTVITILSALFPARRATRVSPMAALRESVPESGRVTAARVVTGVIITALGVAGLGLGLFGSSGNRLAELGAGFMMSILGIAILSPLLVAPVVAVIGVPIARFMGVPGRLARENAERSPRRTASTAAALMIGVALVACVSTVAASFKASIADTIGGAMQASILVEPSGQSPGFSPALATSLRQDGRFRDVEELRAGAFLVGGKRREATAVDPATRPSTIGVTMLSGDATLLGTGTMLVSENGAANNAWSVGSLAHVRFPDGSDQSLRIAGIYKQNQLLGDYMIALQQYAPHSPIQQDTVVLVNGVSGASVSDTQTAIDQVLKHYPTVQSRTRDQFVKDTEKAIDGLLIFLDVLLGFSLIIAVLGIVNTLALSVIERTRELGLLRALGLTRRQTRRMIRWESVIIALLGTGLGIVVGVAIGFAIVQALASQGFSRFTVAGGQLIAAALLAVAFGIIAAIFPARRAARLRLLDALAAE